MNQYTFDLLGNRLRKTVDKTMYGTAEHYETDYTYDANDRLLIEAYTHAGASWDSRFFVYSYGDNNEWTLQTNKAIYYSSWADPTALYTNLRNDHDDLGRMTAAYDYLEYVDEYGDPQVYTDVYASYSYDPEGHRIRLVVSQFGSGGQKMLNYLMDPMNPSGYVQTIEEWAAGGLFRTYVWGAAGLVQQIQSQPADGNSDGNVDLGDFDIWYYHVGSPSGPGDYNSDGNVDLADFDVWFTTVGLPPQSVVLLPDGHGSTRMLTDLTAQVTERYGYDAYGLGLQAMTLTDQGSASTAYRYAGQYTDPYTNLQPLGQGIRWLDMSNGRFGSLDPISPFAMIRNPLGLNTYTYGIENPIKYTDPTGGLFFAPVIPVAVNIALTTTFFIAAASQVGILALTAVTVIGLLGLALSLTALAVAATHDPRLMMTIVQIKETEAIALGQGANPDDIQKARLFFVYQTGPQMTPEIWDHDHDSIFNNGSPVLLYYLGVNRPLRDANRRAAFAANAAIVGNPIQPAGKDLQWDEYPYASTREGGANSFITAVPAWENRRQGGLLSGFYRTVMDRKANPFLVILVPPGGAAIQDYRWEPIDDVANPV